MQIFYARCVWRRLVRLWLIFVLVQHHYLYCTLSSIQTGHDQLTWVENLSYIQPNNVNCLLNQRCLFRILVTSHVFPFVYTCNNNFNKHIINFSFFFKVVKYSSLYCLLFIITFLIIFFSSLSASPIVMESSSLPIATSNNEDK